MYNTKLNNCHQKPKNSTIYIPPEVSKYLFKLLTPHFPNKRSLIFDPCSGENSLLNPWQATGYHIWGNDNDKQLLKQQIPNSDLDFLTSDKSQWKSYFSGKEPTLILCNPPFNGYPGKLASEVWLAKILELFGKEIPLVLFVPYGLCLNLTTTSKRHQKFIKGDYPPISSVIRLPKNIFLNVLFHSEILLFNIPNLQPHYFYHHEI